MRRTVETVLCNSMVRLCVITFVVFLAFTEGLQQNRYCRMNCEYEENLTFTHTVCERGKEVGN